MENRVLSNKIDEINKQISSLSLKKVDEKSIEDLISLTREEIITFLQKYDISQVDEKLGFISLYLRFEQNPSMKSIYPSNSNLGIVAANGIVNEINDCIRKENEAIDKIIQDLQNQLEVYGKINEYFLLDNLSENRVEELTNMITNLQISDEEKLELSIQLSKKIINNFSTKIEPIPAEEDESLEETTYSFEEELEEIISETENRVSEELISIEKDDFETEGQIISEIRKRQIGFANGMISKYFNKSSKCILGEYQDLVASNVVDIFTLEDLQSFIDEDGYGIEEFAYSILINAFNIKDLNNSDEFVRDYYERLVNLDELYTEHSKFISDFSIQYNELEQLFSDLIRSSVSTLKNIDLSEYQQKMISLRNKVGNKILFSGARELIQIELKELINNFKNVSELNGTNNYDTTVVPSKIDINSFVLFATDNTTGRPYIIEDLIGKNANKMIENAAINGSLVDRNYHAGISKLIKDLIIFGGPQVNISKDSSSQNYSEKIENQVFRSKNGKFSRNSSNKTDLWRIRPTHTSNIRFVERKIVLEPGTEIFDQVKNSILKSLPNVEINNNEKFTLFVNVGVGIKKSDTGLYNEVLNRYENEYSNLIGLFYENNRYRKVANQSVCRKEKLNDKDCELLEEYIKNTFEVCDELHRVNEGYDFSFFHEMGGIKKYGL